ncbi:hypothetical protein SAMN05216378_4564 [Paenibacillus catalpae]|uniref:Uncharacterized protein n=1 Tax=Paenibacillus catalpae TaxID=1045775 RepID=A0A1I2EYK3_9BACL|nr:hypothetical protein SAMN05216378_4564 [Paenibacillus catalpae]
MSSPEIYFNESEPAYDPISYDLSVHFGLNSRLLF